MTRTTNHVAIARSFIAKFAIPGNRISRIHVLATLGLTALIATTAGCASSQSQSSTANANAHYSLNVGVSATLGGDGLAWIAQAAGLFKDAGVNVTLTTITTTTVAAEVVSGRVDLASQGSTFPLEAANSGAQTEIVYASYGGGAGAYIAGIPGVNSVMDCTRLATNSIGSSTYAWAVLLKSLFHAKYTIVPLADTPTVLASALSGQSNCVDNVLSNLTPALGPKKLHILFNPVDVASRPSGFPSGLPDSFYWGIRSNIAAKGGAVTRFIEALNRADSLVKKSTPAHIAALLQKLPAWQTISANTLAQEIKGTAWAWAPDGGLVTSDSWTSFLNVQIEGGLQLANPASSTWDYSNRVNMSYLEAAKAG